MAKINDPEKVRNEYFLWILDIMDMCGMPGQRGVTPEYASFSYFLLGHHLHKIVFKPMKELDNNRVEDVMPMLRGWFTRTRGNEYACEHIMNQPVSSLEVLAALALRIDRDIMYHPELSPRHELWFWIMLENLGFTTFSDEAWSIGSCDYVTSTIRMVSTYEIDSMGCTGFGNGLFPLDDLQSSVEAFSDDGFCVESPSCDIWHIAQIYLKHNYDYLYAANNPKRHHEEENPK